MTLDLLDLSNTEFTRDFYFIVRIISCIKYVFIHFVLLLIFYLLRNLYTYYLLINIKLYSPYLRRAKKSLLEINYLIIRSVHVQRNPNVF